MAFSLQVCQRLEFSGGTGRESGRNEGKGHDDAWEQHHDSTKEQQEMR
jgi:hypothetical protein